MPDFVLDIMGAMTHDDHLIEHLELCKRVYERMRREKSWPWLEITDSTELDDLVESEDKSNLS